MDGKNPQGNKYLVAKLNSTNFDVCLVFCLNFICLFFSCTVSSLCTAFSGCGKLGVGYSPALRGQTSHSAGFSVVA